MYITLIFVINSKSCGFEYVYEWTYLWAVRPPQAFIRSASDSLLSINEK